jgi:hypothetical protein
MKTVFDSILDIGILIHDTKPLYLASDSETYRPLGCLFGVSLFYPHVIVRFFAFFDTWFIRCIPRSQCISNSSIHAESLGASHGIDFCN